MKKVIAIIIILAFPLQAFAACTWTDTGDPASANGTRGTGAGDYGWFRPAITLPAGVVSKLRVYIASASYSQGIKLGIYSSDGSTRLAQASQPANTTGTNFWQEIDTSSTPTITAGNYIIGTNMLGNGSDFAYAVLTGQASGKTYVNFNCTGGYGNAMCATATSEGNLTEEMYVGACIEASASATPSLPRMIINGALRLMGQLKI